MSQSELNLEFKFFGRAVSVRRGTIISIAGALALSIACVYAASRFTRPPPPKASAPAGMLVGEKDVQLTANAPQWNSIKLGKAQAATTHWTEPVAARVRIDETKAASIGTPLSGKVTSVQIELGQKVKKGDPLFSVASADLAGLRSEADKAKVDLMVAKTQASRVHDMVEARLLPGKEALSADAQKQQAELSVRMARAKIASLKVSTRRDNEFTLLAPRDGVVVSKNILPSQEVSTEGTLVEIADISTVWVMADVFESDAAGVTPGTIAKITLPSVPGYSIEAPVEMVSSVVDPDRHSVPVRVLLDNADGKLKPNVYAELRFKTTLPVGSSEVASSSLVSDGANQFVYVQEGAGKFVRRKVVAGPVRDGMVAILEGLKPGETVVEQGGILLENQIALTH